MSEPGQTGVQERLFGWIRIGLLGVVIAAGPVWFLATAIAIQLSPDLNGTSGLVEGGPDAVVRHVTWGAWVYMGGFVGFWMLVALPVLLAAILLARFAYLAWHLRERAERARYDAMVASDAVIDDPAWRSSGSGDDRAIGPDPEPAETH